MEIRTLREYKMVAENIKSGARAPDLSYTHHREVAALTPEKQELAYRQQRWGMYDDVAEETGYEMNTLRQYKQVAEQVKNDERSSLLGWSHHLQVAALPPEKQELAYRQQRWGMYDDLAETGYDRDALRDYKRVSESVKSALRNADLGFSHHREVAAS